MGTELATVVAAGLAVQDDVRIGPTERGSGVDAIARAVRQFFTALFGLTITASVLALLGVRGAPAVAISSASVVSLILWRARATMYGRSRALQSLRAALDTPAALEAAQDLASAAWTGDAVRCDASAHEALLRLERGELDRCLAILERPPWDVAARRRPRSAEVGNYGEAVYGVLARVFPDRVTWPLRAAVIADNEPGAPSEYPGLPPMLGALRVLECADTGSPQEVQRAWPDFDADALARTSPLLCALVVERASRVEPGLVQALGARYRALPPEGRAILRERRPEIESLDQSGYRPRTPRP